MFRLLPRSTNNGNAAAWLHRVQRTVDGRRSATIAANLTAIQAAISPKYEAENSCYTAANDRDRFRFRFDVRFGHVQILR
jgi:hypothetical protein